MEATADNLAFAPPPEPAAVRGFVLAVIAHLLLLIALSGLITWQSDDQSSPVQAELWSSIPREAAPAPPPPTPPQPQVQPQPQPKEVQPAPPPPVAKQPDIAVEREKKKREEEEKRRAEDEQRRKQLEAQKRKLEEQKLADEKAHKEELAKQQKEKQQREQLREAARKDQLARMQALAAGSGSPMSQGTAQQSTGPSASYASRLAGIFKRNMHFPVDGIAGNPKVQVKVRVAPGGIILGVQVTTPSGNPAWDDAVVRAIENTPRIPPDEHGKWITEFTLIWGPKDV